MSAKKTVELQMKVDAAGVQPGIDDAQKRLAAFKKWQDDQNAKGGILGASKGAAEQLSRVGMVMVQVAAAAATVEVGIRAWAVAEAAFSGDTEKRAKAMADLADELKALPFGIGAAVKASESLLGLISGIKAETEAINKQTDDQNKAIEYRARLLKNEKELTAQIATEVKKVTDAANSRGTSIRDRVDSVMSAMNPDDFGLKRGITNNSINRELAAENKLLPDAKKALDAAQARHDIASGEAAIEREQGGGDGQKRNMAERTSRSLRAAQEAYSRITANISSLEELRIQSLAKLDQEEAESLKKRGEAESKAEEDRVRKAEEAAKKRAAIEQTLADLTNSAISDQVKAEIDGLRATGKAREADKAQVLEDYEQAVVNAQRQAARIMEAEGATAQDKAAAQGVLSGSVDSAARTRDYKLALLNQPQNQQSPDLAMRSSRFLTGASDKADPQIKLQKSIDDLVSETKRANDLEERRQQVQANAQTLALEVK